MDLCHSRVCSGDHGSGQSAKLCNTLAVVSGPLHHATCTRYETSRVKIQRGTHVYAQTYGRKRAYRMLRNLSHVCVCVCVCVASQAGIMAATCEALALARRLGVEPVVSTAALCVCVCVCVCVCIPKLAQALYDSLCTYHTYTPRGRTLVCVCVCVCLCVCVCRSCLRS